MARRRRNATGGMKAQARKKVTTKLLEREHAGKVTGAYSIMEELVKTVHTHLIDARIAIAWRFGKRVDADGRLWLGSLKKGSDLDRSLHGYDFVILLNHEVWNSAGFSEAQMRALIDHELCHAQVAKDSNGEPKVDEDGRTVYRTRKHDLEEFTEIVSRHGLWKDDVRKFAQAVLDAKDRPLLEKQMPSSSATSEGQHQPEADSPERRWDSVERLAIPARIEKALVDANLTTVTGIGGFTASGKRLVDIPGIGPESATVLADALERFWSDDAPVRRVKLVRPLQGVPDSEGLHEHVELDVVDYDNGNPVVCGDSGVLVALLPEAYVVLERGLPVTEEALATQELQQSVA